MLDLTWLIPALPLAGFLVLVVLGRRLGEPLAGWLATAAVGGSFVASVVVFAGLVGEPEESRAFSQVLFEWVPAGGFSRAITQSPLARSRLQVGEPCWSATTVIVSRSFSSRAIVLTKLCPVTP